MAKFSKKSSGGPKAASKTPNVINRAGGVAYKQTNKLEFISMLLTSYIKDQFYQKADEQIGRVKTLVQGMSDKEFLAKAAIYARNEFGMRSVTHVAAAEIAKTVKGADWTRSFLDKVVHRPDDMTEILAFYMSEYGKPIPNSIKRGFAKAFNKFDGYQLSKYRGDGKEVSLIDVVNLCRPAATEQNRAALEGLVKGTLRATETWEAKLTQAGQNADNEKELAENKADAWKSLLIEKRLGYFAALRNINNMIAQADDETFDMLMTLLVNKKMIKNSLVMPYRYLSALDALTGDSARVRKAKSALNQAIEISCDNIPKFDGKTLVVCDYSGSMGSTITDYRGKGSLFGALLAKSNNADFMIFGDDAALIEYELDTPALKLAEEFMSHNSEGSYMYRHTTTKNGGKIQVGHGTNFNAIFERAAKKYDRIIIFSDMQGWRGGGAPYHSFKSYCTKFGKPKIYSFDLAGYGDMMFPENDVYCLAGFSEKIFDIMKLLETDKKALITKIESVKLKD